MSRFARRLQAAASASPSPVTGTVPYPSYTDYPTITYATLWSQVMAATPANQRTPMTGSGSDVGQVLRGMTSAAYVVLPAGFVGELVDFTDINYYSVYAPKCMGIWGPSSDPSQAIIRLRPMSSTQASVVPTQSSKNTNQLTLMRLGPSGGGVTAAVHCYGWTLAGTDQPNGPNGQPHNYNGIVDYHGANSTYQCMKILGIPGDWNSPPGETFALNSYNTNGSIYEEVEVDGYNEAGSQVGGGVGMNGAVNIQIINCYFHDSYVSGTTFSGAGGAAGTVSQNISTVNHKTWHEANHVVPNTGGKDFPGINHEGVSGYVHHDHPDIKLDNFATLQSPHVFVGNLQDNVSDFVINEPNWHPELGYPGATNGAFVVSVPQTYAGSPNSQTTYPTVIKNGITLQPVIRPAGQGWPSGVDPTTQYILER